MYDLHYKIFLASLLAVWFNLKSKGFKPKHLKFYVELFNDWLSSHAESKNFSIQNTQVIRFCEWALKNKWLKKNSDGQYELHPKSLIQIVRELFKLNETDTQELYFLQYHLITLYQHNFKNGFALYREHFTRGEWDDLMFALDKNELKASKLKLIDKEIYKLKNRIEEIEAMVAYSTEALEKGLSLPQVIKHLEASNPYKLQAQRSMSDFFKELPLDLQRAELTVNATKRSEVLFNSCLAQLKSYQEIVSKLE